MRVAHIIICHKNPAQLLRLVERLQHPQSDIYIHIDQKVSISDFIALENVTNLWFIKDRVKINWGGNSTLVAIVHSMLEVISINENYDFINLLSAQDYVLKSSEEMFDFFKRNSGNNFISYDGSRQTKWWQEASARYEKYHLTDLNIKWKYLLQNTINKIAPKRKFPGKVELYGGNKSAWWTITGDCARYVANELSTNKELLQFLKYCWGTDEFVIATLIMNSRFKHKVINNNLRYIDWSAGNPNPKVLTIEDISSLHESNMLFARKFDINIDTSILDYIDNNMLK